MPDHEVDCLGADLLGRDDDVAFVLAVLVVHQDDHPPGPEFLDRLLDGTEPFGGVRHRRLRGVGPFCYHSNDTHPPGTCLASPGRTTPSPTAKSLPPLWQTVASACGSSVPSGASARRSPSAWRHSPAN